MLKLLTCTQFFVDVDSSTVDCDIFFSMRFNSQELKEAAQLVQRELIGRGINAVIIDTEQSQNIETTVIRTLEQAKLVLIFGSKDYGVDTKTLYCSFKELEYTILHDKPFFLIKMCQQFDDATTRNRLPASLLTTQWNLGQPMPVGLIDDIETKFRAAM